jgi:DNA-binding NtrC family response regulator
MTSSVLVVDDDVAICRILHLMLSNEAYEVKTCHSVSEAISAIEQKAFTVNVVDW